MLMHGSVVRSTMYLASMDIKTVFDEARPRHAAKIMENHDTRLVDCGPPARDVGAGS